MEQTTGRIERIVAVVLLVLGAGAILGGCALRDQAVENTTGQISVAKDATVKAQIMSIKTGIDSLIAASGAAPAEATQATLGGLVDPWPTNPFSNQPMQPGDGAGDYVYAAAGDTSYTLSVHLSDGQLYTVP